MPTISPWLVSGTIAVWALWRWARALPAARGRDLAARLRHSPLLPSVEEVAELNRARTISLLGRAAPFDFQVQRKARGLFGVWSVQLEAFDTCALPAELGLELARGEPPRLHPSALWNEVLSPRLMRALRELVKLGRLRLISGRLSLDLDPAHVDAASIERAVALMLEAGRCLAAHPPQVVRPGAGLPSANAAPFEMTRRVSR